MPEEIKKTSVEDLVNAHYFVVQEMKQRGMKHNQVDELDRKTEELNKIEEELEKKLKDPLDFFAYLKKHPFVGKLIIPDYVSLAGSYGRGEADKDSDLDIVIRRKDRDISTEIRIAKQLPSELQEKLHFVYNPEGPHGDYIPLYDLIILPKKKILQVKEQEEPKKVEIEKRAVSPGTHFAPMKPSMSGVTEYFNTEELWPWVEKKLNQGKKLVGEIKYDGFRTILGNNGKISIWFEDSQEERSQSLPNLVGSMEKVKDVVLDGELIFTIKGKKIPRTQQLSVLAGKLKADPKVYLFDILYWKGEDIHEKPLSERRSFLEEATSKLEKEYFELSPQKSITSKEVLQTVGKWAASEPQSEGLMVKVLDDPYQFGASDSWAKFKTVIELKVAVLKVIPNKAGGYNYEIGVRKGDDQFINITEDKKYVTLGKTFNTKLKANEGDTLNVVFEELLILKDEKGLRLATGKPAVRGIDKSRPAYFATQAVDIARRAGVLKEEIEEIGEIEKRFFTVMGNLERFTDKIMPSFPDNYKEMRYVELFGGAGEMLWQKEISKEEYLNDIDKDIIFLHSFVKNMTNEDFKWLLAQNWKGSETLFNKLKKSKPKTKRAKFYQQLYLRRFSRRSDEPIKDSFRPTFEGQVYDVKPRLLKAKERLKDVKLINYDYEVAFKKLDNSNTLFFCDPPYPGRGKYYQRGEKTDELNFDEVARILSKAKGKVIIVIEGSKDKLKEYFKLFDYKQFNWTHPFSHIDPNVPKYSVAYIFTNFKKTKIEKAKPSEVEETRGERATNFWTNNWQDSYPKSGNGKFVLHAHWRGLTKDEIKLGMEELLQTDHSLHFDLRLQIDNKQLHGWTIFAGQTKENKSELLVEMLDKRKAQVTPKQPQPIVWLNVAKGKPYVSEPMGVGATSNLYAKFFAIDFGAYHVGVWRAHSFEYFIKGKILNGRYLITYAPLPYVKCLIKAARDINYQRFREEVLARDRYKCVKCGSKEFLTIHHLVPKREDSTQLLLVENGQTLCWKCHEELNKEEAGRRVWLLSKPEDQTPYAKSHKLEEVLSEIKSKGQQYLIWCDGKSKPIKYKAKTGEIIKRAQLKLLFLGTGPTESVKGKGRDNRTNSSLFIQGSNILIDCTPQFEEQIKREKIDPDDIKAILLTHAHTDAIGGLPILDNLIKNKLSVYAPPKVLINKRFKKRFKNLIFKPILPHKQTELNNLKVTPFRVIHAEAFPTGKNFSTYGYKFNNIIYAEDMEAIPKNSDVYFENNDIIIADAALWFNKQIRGHLNVKQSLELAKKYRPKLYILIQAGHTYPHWQKANSIIQQYWQKNGIEETRILLAYDGLEIDTSNLNNWIRKPRITKKTYRVRKNMNEQIQKMTESLKQEQELTDKQFVEIVINDIKLKRYNLEEALETFPEYANLIKANYGQT